MSLKAQILKAKLEAVIYAAEEPVTLAQLTGLLGEEAQADLDALAAQQQSLALEDESAAADPPDPDEDEDGLNAEILDTSGVEATTPEPPAPDETKLARDRARKLRDYFRTLLDELIADYADPSRGLELR
jgi:segregation and condensation protein B